MKVGLIVPLTGDIAAMEQGMNNGATLFSFFILHVTAYFLARLVFFPVHNWRLPTTVFSFLLSPRQWILAISNYCFLRTVFIYRLSDMI